MGLKRFGQGFEIAIILFNAKVLNSKKQRIVVFSFIAFKNIFNNIIQTSARCFLCSTCLVTWFLAQPQKVLLKGVTLGFENMDCEEFRQKSKQTTWNRLPQGSKFLSQKI